MSSDKDDLPIEDDFVAVDDEAEPQVETAKTCLLYTSPSPRDS